MTSYLRKLRQKLVLTGESVPLVSGVLGQEVVQLGVYVWLQHHAVLRHQVSLAHAQTLHGEECYLVPQL